MMQKIDRKNKIMHIHRWKEILEWAWKK